MITIEFFGFECQTSRSLQHEIMNALRANRATAFLVERIVAIHQDNAKVHDSEDDEFSFVRVSSIDEKHIEAISQILESFSSKKIEKKIYVIGQTLCIATNLSPSTTRQSTSTDDGKTTATA